MPTAERWSDFAHLQGCRPVNDFEWHLNYLKVQARNAARPLTLPDAGGLSLSRAAGGPMLEGWGQSFPYPQLPKGDDAPRGYGKWRSRALSRQCSGSLAFPLAAAAEDADSASSGPGGSVVPAVQAAGKAAGKAPSQGGCGKAEDEAIAALLFLSSSAECDAESLEPCLAPPVNHDVVSLTTEYQEELPLECSTIKAAFETFSSGVCNQQLVVFLPRDQSSAVYPSWVHPSSTLHQPAFSTESMFAAPSIPAQGQAEHCFDNPSRALHNPAAYHHGLTHLVNPAAETTISVQRSSQTSSSTLHPGLLYARGRCEQAAVRIKFDVGAEHDFISKDLVEELGLCVSPGSIITQTNGGPVQLDFGNVTATFGMAEYEASQDFHVGELGPYLHMILGKPWHNHHNAVVYSSTNTVTWCMRGAHFSTLADYTLCESSWDHYDAVSPSDFEDITSPCSFA